MTQARKRRGMRTQALVAQYLAGHGWPFAESTGAGRSGSDVTGVPGLAIEVKARTDLNPIGWLKQAEMNAGLPIVVHRPNGVGEDPARYVAMVRLADLVPLLLAAGYGGYVQEPPSSSGRCEVDGHEQALDLRVQQGPPQPTAAPWEHLTPETTPLAVDAARVLREHEYAWHEGAGAGLRCPCPTWNNGSLWDHLADALAAAGLLVTPEHDAQVAARALREAADRFIGDGIVMEATVRDLLRRRADRIQRQEDPR